jgi:hypothetical protein
MVEKPSHNLHNYILRHACKKNVFRFSEPFFARLASKFEKSTNMTIKTFFLIKKSRKNAKFHADFKSIEKVLKKFTKKKL